MYPRHEVTRPRPAAGPAEQPAAVSAAEAGLALHLYISVDKITHISDIMKTKHRKCCVIRVEQIHSLTILCSFPTRIGTFCRISGTKEDNIQRESSAFV